MTTNAVSTGLKFERRLTTPGVSPFEVVSWAQRDAIITDAKGNVRFEQRGVMVPDFWSETATTIVASKYFHGQLGTDAREYSVSQLIRRVADTIADWGKQDGYFASEEDAISFHQELISLLLNQYLAFNSPVWFNVGCDRIEPDNRAKSWHYADGKIVQAAAGYSKPQCSACFINSVDDSMESILELAKTEGMLFKHGSGTGSNLSAIRAANEALSGGGSASGPLSFMRGYDAFAGVIKSGGKTRRAAKMVILNADHPDIVDFIRCKGKEEAKAHALVQMGYDGNGPDSEAYESVFFQNANNSVRATDEFMEAVVDDLQWALTARTDGRIVDSPMAKDLMHLIATETWKCGDPGMQFDTTINRWNPCSVSGRINASNPCSEYMFLDDSACNLASLNLVKFLREDGTFDVELFSHAVRISIVAQDILVDHSGYPTEKIAANSHDFRPLGLGYANLGALLMRLGLPYDSDEGRTLAAGITALMTGKAYATSAELASEMPPLLPVGAERTDNWKTGSFPRYPENASSFLAVMAQHRDAMTFVRESLPGIATAAARAWADVCAFGSLIGFRNAQVTVLAPTGTIGFMMDCDTTGIEPMLGLVAYKKLVGGGYMTLVNQSARVALERLGYTGAVLEGICSYITDKGTIEGAPGFDEEHLPIFDGALRPANGTRSLHWRGHVAMMAVCQPFLSGAISKTVNLPSEATVDDIANAYIESWKAGLKAIAIYRDGSKAAQPMSVSKDNAPASSGSTPTEEPDLSGPPVARRHRLPAERASITHKFGIAGHEGYITVGLYPNGKPGEIFLKMAKEGSTLSGLMDTVGTLASVALQSGVPLHVLCDKLAHMSFEPSGWTGSEEMGYAKSLIDYVFRWLRLRFIEGQQLVLPHLTPGVPAAVSVEEINLPPRVGEGDAPTCSTCGSLMDRKAGSCWACSSCGSTSGGCS